MARHFSPREGEVVMAGLMSTEEVFEKTQVAAVAATAPDEKALQIDYPALRDKIRAALADRKVALCHVNKFLPEGYEEQGRFNVLLLTAGNRFFRLGVCPSFFPLARGFGCPI